MQPRFLILLCITAMALPALAPAEAAKTTTAATCVAGFTLNGSYSNGFVGPATGDFDWWNYNGNDVVYTLTPLTSSGDLVLEVYDATCGALCYEQKTLADGSEQCRAIGVGPHSIVVTLANAPGASVKYRLDPWKIA